MVWQMWLSPRPSFSSPRRIKRNGTTKGRRKEKRERILTYKTNASDREKRGEESLIWANDNLSPFLQMKVNKQPPSPPVFPDKSRPFVSEKKLKFPILLYILLQVVQEYERAVIFRLGRLLSGGSRGPGNKKIHYILTSGLLHVVLF